MIKVRQKLEGHIVYFRFFTSEKFPKCFWHTKTTESVDFELSRIDDYEPLNKTWEDIRDEKI